MVSNLQGHTRLAIIPRIAQNDDFEQHFFATGCGRRHVGGVLGADSVQGANNVLAAQLWSRWRKLIIPQAAAVCSLHGRFTRYKK